MHRGGALRHPDCSAPRLGSRFAVGTGRLCQIKFWLMQVMGFAEDDEVWQAYLATFRQRLQDFGWSEGRNSVRLPYENKVARLYGVGRGAACVLEGYLKLSLVSCAHLFPASSEHATP